MIKVILCDFGRVLINTKDLSYTGSHDELHSKLSQNLNYHVLDHFELNHELMQYLESLRGKYGLYVLTGGAVYEVSEVKGELLKLFQGIYSKDVGSKADPKTYSFVAKDLNITTENILFIDDSSENTQAAEKAGCKVILYKSNNQTFKDIENIINHP